MHEILEIVWIDRDSNPTNMMAKAHLYQVLQDLINTNRIDLWVMGWVKRSQEREITSIRNISNQSLKTKSSQYVTSYVPSM
jgi:hypothetical protein